MSSPILFSVVIPTFNRASYIMKTLQSILSQQDKNFEVIVVDDGSEDDTGEVVASVTDERIRYFKTENKERGAARNFGIRMATGDYVTFLDSDDLMKVNHLDVAHDFLKKNEGVDVFHLGYDVISPDGTIQHKWRPLPDPANEKLIEGNFLSCLGVFVRREILKTIYFQEDRDLSGSEDYELWIRLAARYAIRTVSSSTAWLVNHDDRSVLFINPEKFVKRIKLTKNYIEQDEKVKERFGNRVPVLFAYLDLYAALHFAISGHPELGRQSLKSSLTAHPKIIGSYRFWVVVKKLLFS